MTVSTCTLIGANPSMKSSILTKMVLLIQFLPTIRKDTKSPWGYHFYDYEFMGHGMMTPTRVLYWWGKVGFLPHHKSISEECTSF